MIYQMSRDDPNVSETTKKAFAWIPNAILHGYYVAGIKDRLLVERLFTTLFPSVKSAEISMKKLYHLFATVDEKAIKALIEIVKIQAAIGKALSNLAAAPKKEIAPCVAHLSKYLPYPTKEAKQILKFADDLAKDDLKKLLKNYLDLEKSCVERMDAANQLSRKPEMINQTNAVKLLMKRMSSLFIDKKAVQYLVSILFLRLLILSIEFGFLFICDLFYYYAIFQVEYVEGCLTKKDGNLANDIGMDPDSVGRRGLELLVALAFYFPVHFVSKYVLRPLLNIFSAQAQDPNMSTLLLRIFTFVGKYRSKDKKLFATVTSPLVAVCMKLAIEGTLKQAKHALRCLHAYTENPTEVFSPIFDSLKGNLFASSPDFPKSIVILGHMVLLLPDVFSIPLQDDVATKIVRDLLLKVCF